MAALGEAKGEGEDCGAVWISRVSYEGARRLDQLRAAKPKTQAKVLEPLTPVHPSARDAKSHCHLPALIPSLFCALLNISVRVDGLPELVTNRSPLDSSRRRTASISLSGELCPSLCFLSTQEVTLSTTAKTQLATCIH